MKAGSYIKNKDGTLKENAKDAAMKARTDNSKTTKEADGVKAESAGSGKN